MPRILGKKIVQILSCALCALCLGFCIVWVNIELVNISYQIEKLQTKIKKEEELNAKLKVEKMNLSSSYILREKASRLDLKPPQPSQIRKLKGRKD